MTPPHTHTANCSARITEFTISEFGTPPHSYKPTQRLLTRKRTIDRMVDHYILLWHLEKSSLEHTRNDTASYTCDRKVHNILDASTLSK